MRNVPGRILNVDSIAGFLSWPNMAVYHATKAYLISLPEAVSEELSGSGVTVTALCPDATETNFFANDDAVKASIISRFPLPTAETMAAKGWSAMTKGRRIYVPGIMNKVFSFLPSINPRRVNVFVTGQFLRRRR